MYPKQRLRLAKSKYEPTGTYSVLGLRDNIGLFTIKRMEIRFDRDRLEDVTLTLDSAIQDLRRSSDPPHHVPSVLERHQIPRAITDKYKVEGQIDFVGGEGDNMISWLVGGGTHILLLGLSDRHRDMSLSYSKLGGFPSPSQDPEMTRRTSVEAAKKKL